MNKIRESNFEFMRIVSMLMIITGHTFSWGGVLKSSAPNISSVIYLIYAIIMVEVNSFILLTGYFQSTSKFKLKKFIKVLFLMYFYKILITTIGYFLGWFSLSKTELLFQLSPFDFSNYWFLKIYLILYCLSPFINKVMNKLSRDSYKKLLIIIFVFCSVLVNFTNGELFNNSSGYSLVQFIFMYMIGMYLRKYVINEETKNNLYKNKVNLFASIYICISIFILCFIANYSMFRIGNYLMSKSGIYSIFGHTISSMFLHYDNPLVIIGSVGYFMFFALIKLKSKLINILSACVMEVYIIHETVLFRSTLYSFLGLGNLKYTASYSIFIKIILVVFIIFIGATIIEYLRRLIFLLFKIIFRKLKINNKIAILEQHFDSWINI